MGNLKLYNAIKVSILVLDEADGMLVTFANPFFFLAFGINSMEEVCVCLCLWCACGCFGAEIYAGRLMDNPG